MAAFSSGEILAQWDQHAGDYTFPMLDNGYVFLVDTRLTAWRDDHRWALAIEVVGYSPRSGQLDCVIHRYGNCVEGPTGTRNEDFICPVTSEVEDPSNPEHAIPGLLSISLRGNPAPLANRSDSCRLENLYRGLTPSYRHWLFSTQQELTAYFPQELGQILRLDDWHHPNLVLGELPSANHTFRQIADVLCSGDASLYRPSSAPNTHWMNWPDGGSL